MCTMTETATRGMRAIPRSGKYLVCKGNHTGLEFYIPYDSEDMLELLSVMKPIYAVRVKAKAYVELCT